MFSVEKIEEKINYKFKNKELLKTAFTHSSLANEKRTASNERLEFLGDSVLSLVITDRIYHHFKLSEGDLSKIRASLVSEDSLSLIMEELGMDEQLLCGAAFNGKKPTKAMVADSFEAMVAAIYLDGGEGAAKNFILGVFKSAMSDIDSHGVPDSAKSRLQEKFKNARIVYKTEVTTQNLEKIYNCRVFVNGVMSGIGASTKKKVAEEIAARQALEKVIEV